MLALTGGAPVVLMGDFNFEPDAMPYQLLMDSSRWNIKDSYDAVEKAQHGRPCTFTGFKVKDSECKRIDYIFTNEHFSVKSYDIAQENDGKHYPSDHLPVVVDLVW